MRRGRRGTEPCPQCATAQPVDARWCGGCGASLRAERDRRQAEGGAGEHTRRTGRPRRDRSAAEPGRWGRWTAGGALLALLVGLLAVQEQVAPTSSPAGYTRRGDAAGSGRISTVTLPAPTEEVWRDHVALPPLLPEDTAVLGTTAVDGTTVVVVRSPAEDGDRIVVHDAADGTLRWTTMLPLGALASTPAVGSGLLAQMTLDSVTLLDLAAERRLWTAEARLREVIVTTPFGVVGRPAGGPGAPIALVGLGREDGSIVWRWEHDGAGALDHIVADDLAVVVAGTDDQGGFVASIDPVTGAERWVLHTDTQPATAPTPRLTGDGRVLVDAAGRRTTVDVLTGAVAPVEPGSDPVPAALGGDTVVVHDDATVERLAGDSSVWRVPTIAVHLPDMVADDGSIAVTTPVGVEVHDSADGTTRWAYEAFDEELVDAGTLGGLGIAAGRVVASPAVAQPVDRGGVFGVLVDSGIASWSRRGDQLVPRGTPVVTGDLVWVPVGETLLGFDPVRGLRRAVVQTELARDALAVDGDWLATTTRPLDDGSVWVGRITTGRATFNAPIRTCATPVIVDDLVLLVSHDGDIVARTLVDGTQPWGERAGGSACRPLTLTDETFVALVDDRELLAVTLDGGDTAWRQPLSGTAAAAPVRIGDELVVPTLDGMVRAFDAGTGAPRWQVDAGVVAAASVAVDGRTLVVLGRDGSLVGLR